MSAPQRTPEWFAERAELSITGSMVGMVLGHSPYGDYQTALRNKVREVLQLPPDRPANAAMKRGIEMEPVARDAYEAHTGRLVEEVGLIRDQTTRWFGSSPDGVTDGRVLEIKVRNTPKPIVERAWEYDQCQAHMIVTGHEKCDYWQWNESGGVLETVDFDHDWWEQHSTTLFQFHDDLQQILGDDELQKPFREPLVTERTDSAWAEAAAHWLEVKAVLDAAKEAEEKCRAVVLTLADNKACEGAGIKVTTFERTGAVNWKAKDIQNALAVAGVNPEEYRGKPSTQTRITTK